MGLCCISSRAPLPCSLYRSPQVQSRFCVYPSLLFGSSFFDAAFSVGLAAVAAGREQVVQERQDERGADGVPVAGRPVYWQQRRETGRRARTTGHPPRPPRSVETGQRSWTVYSRTTCVDFSDETLRRRFYCRAGSALALTDFSLVPQCVGRYSFWQRWIIDITFSALTLLLFWATGRASGCVKTGCWFAGGDDLHAAVVTTTSIILISNKIQYGNILVSANPGPRGKWPLKRRDYGY